MRRIKIYSLLALSLFFVACQKTENGAGSPTPPVAQSPAQTQSVPMRVSTSVPLQATAVAH